MLLSRKNKGLEGEELVVKFLKKKGYKILERNYTNKHGYRKGEIDIIARDVDEIVFVEVKMRRKGSAADLRPESFVTPEKFRKLERIARDYLYSFREVDTRHRFDVVAIETGFSGEVSIKHIEHAFL